MRRLDAPALAFGHVYDTCTTGIGEGEVRDRLDAIRDAVVQACIDYEQRASAHTLHALPAAIWGHGEQVVLGDATKSDFVSLYDSGMVKNHPDGRAIYDALLNSAPLGRCPYCGFAAVGTLDHFVPKAYYPVHAVNPANLVPACTDCNKIKKSSRLTEATQSCHPYFELASASTDVWLVASVVEQYPVSVTYTVQAPAHWDQSMRRRVSNHFDAFDLGPRYAKEAGAELVVIRELLRNYTSAGDRREFLQTAANAFRQDHSNSWRGALYAGLADSSWYVENVVID